MNYSFGAIQSTAIIQSLKRSHACRIQHDSYFGDAGCKLLFRWLKTGIDSEVGNESPGAQPSNLNISTANDNSKLHLAKHGFPKHLSIVELVDVGIGDIGLQELIDWLRSLQKDRQNVGEQNKIQGTSDIAEAFISSLSISFPSTTALGSFSTLSSLILSTNPLSTSFRRTLLDLLPALPGLRRLLLAFTGMDNTDAIALAGFIGSGIENCKLEELNASANNMGYKGLQTIVNAVRHCWTLEKVEMFSNGLPGDTVAAEEIQKDTEDVRKLDENNTTSNFESANMTLGSGTGYSVLDRKLKYFLNRNIILRRQVASQAFDLLKYSRLMLPNNIRLSSFSLLPMEIQLSILTHLAPLLSSKQRIRVFEYAADKTSLPSVKLSLPDHAHATRLLRPSPSSRPGSRYGSLKSTPPSYAAAPGGTQRLAE
ncbi:hypothetical protein CPB84DRAFT_1769387, partial [Gymnopilus junonius]